MPWKCFPITTIRMRPIAPPAHLVPAVDNGCLVVARRVPHYTLPDGREVIFEHLAPGAVWHSSSMPDWAFAPGWCVVVPGKATIRLGEAAHGGGRWTVNGRADTLTVVPGIHYVSMWRGVIVDGEISDDADGREYDDHGYKLRARERGH
jgi:hypothetical protein